MCCEYSGDSFSELIRRMSVRVAEMPLFVDYAYWRSHPDVVCYWHHGNGSHFAYVLYEQECDMAGPYNWLFGCVKILCPKHHPPKQRLFSCFSLLRNYIIHLLSSSLQVIILAVGNDETRRSLSTYFCSVRVYNIAIQNIWVILIGLCVTNDSREYASTFFIQSARLSLWKEVAQISELLECFMRYALWVLYSVHAFIQCSDN